MLYSFAEVYQSFLKSKQNPLTMNLFVSAYRRYFFAKL